METICYCADKINCGIFNTRREWQGLGYIQTIIDHQSKLISIHNMTNEQILFAHCCNKKEFKCSELDCSHLDGGEVPLMKIIYFSYKKYWSNLLNEQFVNIYDFQDLNELLMERNCTNEHNKYQIKHNTYVCELYCELCKLSIKTIQLLNEKNKYYTAYKLLS